MLLALLLAASTWRVYGHTWDEPEHLAAGMELLDRGQYEYDTEHPPIARLFLALGPFFAGSHSFGTPPPNGVQEGVDILYDGGHYDRTLTLARLGALPFLALLLLAMWLWARRVTSTDGEALLAVLLLVTVPPIIGHAALAALDVPGTATTLFALYWMQRWLVTARLWHAVMFGLGAGVAVATKLSAMPFLMVGLLVTGVATLLLNTAASHVKRAAGVIVLCAVVLVPICAAYGPRSFELTALPGRCSWVLPYLFQDAATLHRVSTAVGQLRLPEGLWDFAEGVVALKAHNDTGHISFLLGQQRAGGWWYFYLVALAVKTPLPLLATGPLGMIFLARDGWRIRNPWGVAPLLLFVGILIFASTVSRINIGIRHVLILYPFMALGSAWLLGRAWQSLLALERPALITAARTILAVALWWQISVLWRAYPDYFPYFNELVATPQRVLVDSDLDWGQDLRRLEERLAERKVPRISLAYQGTADLAREPLPPVARIGPGQRASGWVAITALVREHEPAGYAWLDQYRPVERIGKTIDLYYISTRAAGP